LKRVGPHCVVFVQTKNVTVLFSNNEELVLQAKWPKIKVQTHSKTAKKQNMKNERRVSSIKLG